MRFASSVSTASDTRQALDELLGPISERVAPADADLVLVFASGHEEEALEPVLRRLRKWSPQATLIGCTAEGTIGVDKELERTPAMSLLAASLPGVDIRPFHIDQRRLQSLETTLDWERTVGAAPERKPVFVAMADPFRFAVLDFVEQLNEAYPGSPLVGGVASAGASGGTPGRNLLWINDETYHEGVIGVALTGRLSVSTVVSQGCRPIGKPFVITRAEENIIKELRGKPALVQLHRVLVDLNEKDEALARQSLFVGKVIDEYKERFERGDFLIHNIIGVDRQSGALAIAGYARVGSTVQFHVRDAASADEDLREMLTPYTTQPIHGAMLFGCNGRGMNMWPRPGHDIGVVREMLGNIPVAGFFCGGEFGPVGGKNFLHGFTASIALFHEPAEKPAE